MERLAQYDQSISQFLIKLSGDHFQCSLPEKDRIDLSVTLADEMDTIFELSGANIYHKENVLVKYCQVLWELEHLECLFL